MNYSTTKKLHDVLSCLYKENKQLAIKIESCWGTEVCSSILTKCICERHAKNVDTTYKEYHALLKLAHMHDQLYENCDIQNILQK